MIVERIHSFFDWFSINSDRRKELEALAEKAAHLANGMTDYKDYLALAAILESTQPKKILEIGTYNGITSNFFLQVLPNCDVISVAFVNPENTFFKKKYNNSDLTENEIGSYVKQENKSRFTQIIGNSHLIKAKQFVKDYGKVDLVFIDGDHSAKGVHQDTELAEKILSPTGTICWHDANPKERYMAVRNYLENKMKKPAIATHDDYIGGIACWNFKIESKFSHLTYV
ncbi:MAG: hypothetical protein S4CHLAM7_03420 [Chlamydiae bacterium]|nr:hypothetical protein [Chlamydiota bacterium]